MSDHTFAQISEAISSPEVAAAVLKGYGGAYRLSVEQDGDSPSGYGLRLRVPGYISRKFPAYVEIIGTNVPIRVVRDLK